MFVRSTMKPSYRCYVVSPHDPLNYALNELDKHNIQAMPVVEGNKFKGMVSKQLIYNAFFHSNLSKDEFLSNETVAEIVTNQNLFIEQDEVFEKTLSAFKDFPILAVTDKNNDFKGIITRFDVIEQLESVFGTKKQGIRIAFTSQESEGRMARLMEIISQLHANIISITTFDETDKLARRVVIKLDPKINAEKIAKKLEKSGFRVLDITEV